MPYIEPTKRQKLVENCIEEVSTNSAGELNFCISKLIHNYLEERGHLRYSVINEVIGVLECAKLELYRMVASPYENKKRLENGPVSSLDSIQLEDVR